MVVEPSEKLEKWCEKHYGEKDAVMPMDLQREKAMLFWRAPSEYEVVDSEAKKQLLQCLKEYKDYTAVFAKNKDGYFIGVKPFANTADRERYKEARKKYPLIFVKK